MKKRILLYMVVMVIVICGLSMLQMVDISKVDLLYYVALLITTGLGGIHLFMMYKNRFPQRFQIFGFRFWLTVLIMVISFILSVIVYRLANLEMRFLTFIIPFGIPYIIYQTYLIYSRLLSGKQTTRD